MRNGSLVRSSLLALCLSLSVGVLDSAAESLYQRLGGEAAIKAVVEDFVGRAAANPKVNFTRKGHPREWKVTPEGLERLKTLLTQFIASNTGGTEKYEGRDMKSAHVGMKITASEFTALAEDLAASLTKFKVAKKEQDELLAIVSTTKGDIVEG